MKKRHISDLKVSVHETLNRGEIMNKIIRLNFIWIVSIALLVISGGFMSPVSTVMAQTSNNIIVDNNISVQGQHYPVEAYANQLEELNTTISLQVDNQPVERVLREIVEYTDLGIAYASGSDELLKKISLDEQFVTVGEALSLVLEKVPYEASISPTREIILTLEPEAVPDEPEEAFQEIVEGQVTDATTGEPLPGVTIIVDGTQTGTTTDPEGNFQIEVEDLDQALRFSYIGYEQQLVAIGGRTEINVELSPEVEGMDEVVVVGYGVQQRSDLTGSISSVPMQEIRGQSVSNIEQGLQGRMAGVDIRHSSGEPGSPMEIQIRGIGTFGNNDPLYILDGVPVQSEDMTHLNPRDIESIEVLKDASAAAIYGARAANGVVLITTARGADGAPTLEYEGSYGFSSFTDHEDLLNSEQYAELAIESAENDGRTPESAWLDPGNVAHNSPWQEEAFETAAPMMEHNLSLSGGTENARYSVSGDYLGQDGVFVYNWVERYSGRINTEFDISDRLTIGQTANFSRVSHLNRGKDSNLYFSYLLGGAPTMRIFRPENEGGYAGPNPAETGVNSRANAIGRRDLRRTYDYNNRFIGDVHANLRIFEDLEYQFRLGLNANTGLSEGFVPTHNMDGRSATRASKSETRREGHDLLLENTLTYTTELFDEHRFTALAGFTQENSTQAWTSASINDFPSNDLQVIDAGTGDMTAGGNKTEWALRSFFGRLNATLFDRYLLTATFRRDGSSRFGVDDRWGNFPSFAVGWLINQEDFWPDIAAVDELKLRASWGQLGNQQIGNYVNQTTVDTEGIFYMFGGAPAPGAAITSLGNPFILWETTTQTDIGVDLELFGQRLLLVADYYVKDTEDVLLRVPISEATGIARGSGPFQNAAGVRNSGVEFEARYRDRIGTDFSYSVSGNIATVNNEVTSLGGESAIIDWVDNAYGIGTYTYTTVGEPISSFYGWEFDGIFQNQEEIDSYASPGGTQPGDVRFRDLTGDGEITDEDRTIIGSPIPDFTYGFTVNMSYRNWDLNMALHGVHGRDLYNVNRAYLENLGLEWNQRTTVLDRWQGEGTSNTMPRASRDQAFSNTRAQDRFVEDASYLRLQSLQLGYTLPVELTNAMGMRNMRVYFNGQNLLTLTGYSNWNPDVRGGAGWSTTDVANPLTQGVDLGTYPVPRIVQLGVQLSF